MASPIQPPASPQSATASPTGWLGPAVWVVVLGSLIAFFAFMAVVEPLTGDGWYNADDASGGVTVKLLVDQLTYLHNNGNPRIGQAFTLLTYGSRPFHLIATPFVSICLMLLIVAHGLGRLPSPKSARDGLMVLTATAASFLAAPQPGHTFFYRPITTNYLYTLMLSLAFFLPLRLDVRARSLAGSLAMSLFALATGVFIGKTNEHTGPTMILVAAVYAGLALREHAKLDVAWRASATVGLLVGYLFLFFAPGQERRYGDLGRQSVFDTVIDRGLMGTATLLGEYCTYVGPLLFGMGLLGLLCVTVQPTGTALESFKRIRWTVAGYVIVSCLILGTTLAAPKNHYRLFIAPALLLVVAAIAALRAAEGRWPITAVAVSSSLVVACTMLIFAPMYSQIHADELERNEIIMKADPKKTVIVPRTRYAKRSSYYYGDSITADPRHRDRMERIFHVKEIKLIPKPEQELRDQKKAKKKAKKKIATVGPVPTEVLDVPDGSTP